MPPLFLRLQLGDIVGGLSADKWSSMLPAIEDNFNRAKQYGAIHFMTQCFIQYDAWLVSFGVMRDEIRVGVNRVAGRLMLGAGNDWDYQFSSLLPQMQDRLGSVR